MKQHLIRLERSVDTWFLLPILFIFTLCRLPSLIEPYWYGDEGIYEIIGRSLAHGRLLYVGIWDNKPPLLYLTYALFAGDQFAAKLLSLLFGIASVIVFFIISKKLFPPRRLVYLTTAIFALLFATPITEGNIANAENFMLLPILLAAYLLIKNVSERKIAINVLFTAGLFLGLAFLYKIVALFDFAAFVVFLICLIAPRENDIKKLLSPSWMLQVIPLIVFLSIGFILPLLVTTLFFILQGAGNDFYHSVFSSNVGYVGYGNTFIIPQGFLIVKLLLLAGAVGFIFYKRAVLSPLLTFALFWLCFSVFDSFFSQRNYTHYFLMLIPSLSLGFGLPILAKKGIDQLWITILVALLAIVTMTYFLNTRYLQLIPYYTNYLQYITNHKSVDIYQAFFDQHTPRDYMVADYIRVHTKPNDTVFIWGNSAQVYVLSQTFPPGRYAVAYHIQTSAKALAETQEAVKKTKPKFIFVFNNAASFPFPAPEYRYLESLSTVQIYEKNN